MRNYILLIVFLFSCNEIINEKLEISNSVVIINISDEITFDGKIYHLYFKNIIDNDKSIGINVFDLSNDIQLEIFPGNYEIYSYGLIDKTSTSKMVDTYCILKNITFKSGKKDSIILNFKELIPDIKITETDKILLSVDMCDLYDIFSVSSLSVKQGSDRVRSVDIDFIDDQKIYISEITYYESGSWYLNISYSLKSMKDKNALEKDNIYISTSYFKNIYLGEY